MGIFKKANNKLEGAVEGAFGRAFKSSVQPVELAHKLTKEMGDHKTVGVSNVYVPNEFEVYLGSADYEHMASLGDSLKAELANYVVAFARREHEGEKRDEHHGARRPDEHERAQQAGTRSQTQADFHRGPRALERRDTAESTTVPWGRWPVPGAGRRFRRCCRSRLRHPERAHAAGRSRRGALP